MVENQKYTQVDISNTIEVDSESDNEKIEQESDMSESTSGKEGK